MTGRNDELLSGHTPHPPREPTPGEVIWTLTKDGHTYRAELRNLMEIQLFKDGELDRANLHPSRALALQQATSWRAVLEAKGWGA